LNPRLLRIAILEFHKRLGVNHIYLLKNTNEHIMEDINKILFTYDVEINETIQKIYHEIVNVLM